MIDTILAKVKKKEHHHFSTAINLLSTIENRIEKWLNQ